MRHGSIAHVVERRYQAPIVRLHFIRKHHCLFVVRERYIEMPLRELTHARLHGGIDLFRKARRGFGGAHTGFQCRGFGDFARSLQRRDMLLQSRLRLLVLRFRNGIIRTNHFRSQINARIQQRGLVVLIDRRRPISFFLESAWPISIPLADRTASSATACLNSPIAPSIFPEASKACAYRSWTAPLLGARSSLCCNSPTAPL